MGKKKLWIILALLIVLPVFLFVPARAADGQLLSNARFDEAGIPDEWSVRSYLKDGYTVAVGDGVVTLSSDQPNDLRLIQTVSVEEESVYLLTGEIMTHGVRDGRGASLSIDNYIIDGSYIYSDSIMGSADWTPVTMVFRTGQGQDQINVALRLGGYSASSAGTAAFRNICLEKGSADMAGIKSLNNTAASASESKSEEMTEMRKLQLKSYLHLFVVIAVVAAVFLLFGVYRNRDELGSIPIPEDRFWKYFALVVIAGCVLRSVLCSAWKGHDSDMSCWMGWGNYIAQHGTATFYTAPGHEWYDYPPGYMLVLGVISRLLSVFHITGSSGAAVFAYMIPAFAADILSAVLVILCARKNGFSRGWQLLLGTVVIFNPAAVMLSGAWGQIDSILTLFLVLAFVEFTNDRRIFAGALYGLAIMIKWQALIYGPVFACAYLLRLRGKRDAAETVGAVVSALAVIFLLSMPFKGAQGIFWVFEKFLKASGGYDYASVEAYNFLALCGGNWAPSGKQIFPGISYKVFGTVSILASVCLSILMLCRSSLKNQRRNGRPEVSPAGLFLCQGFCMFMIYTFGHYMHERYVFPVMLLFLLEFLFTREKRFLLCSLALSVVLFLNEMTAMYVVSDLAASVVRSGKEHQAVTAICSMAETALFIYSAYASIEHVFRAERRGESAGA